MTFFWRTTITYVVPAAPAVQSVAAPVPPTSVAAPSADTQAAMSTFTVPGWQVEMLNDVNGQRAAAGLGALTLCPRLDLAAVGHSDDQAATNRLSHVGSNGSGLGQRANAAGYLGWTTLGENIGEGFTTVDSVMAAWMNSPDHRANILGVAFTNVGFGAATSSSGLWFWTQDFGVDGGC